MVGPRIRASASRTWPARLAATPLQAITTTSAIMFDPRPTPGTRRRNSVAVNVASASGRSISAIGPNSAAAAAAVPSAGEIATSAPASSVPNTQPASSSDWSESSGPRGRGSETGARIGSED